MESLKTTATQIIRRVREVCENLFNSAKTFIKTKIDNHKEIVYANAFRKCLTALADEVYGIHDPYDIAQRALRTACDFYKADWCGMFDVDMMLDLWMPYWWFNKQTGGMTQTQLKEGYVMGNFDMFRKMIENNATYYQPNIDNIRTERPEEYALFSTQSVKSFLSVPYSRREQGILFLRNPKRFADNPDMLRIISNILLQELNEQKHRELMKVNAATEEMRKDADIIINLFGGIEVMTDKGRVAEAEMNSAVCKIMQ